MLQPYPERKNGIIPVDDGDWRAIVLNVMVRRSFELWPKLTSSDIMRGLALTTQKAKSSVGGKLGMMNGRNIHQVDECWQVTNYKFHSKHINFSVEAKEAARRRARKWNIKNMN